MFQCLQAGYQSYQINQVIQFQPTGPDTIESKFPLRDLEPNFVLRSDWDKKYITEPAFSECIPFCDFQAKHSAALDPVNRAVGLGSYPLY